MFAIDFKYLGILLNSTPMTYLKNSTKKSLFAPNFSSTNLQSKEEAKKSATELLAVIVGHEIFTDTSECAIIMANNIVCAKR